MADARPFRGFRFDLGRAGALSDLVCPPYDVIDENLRAALLQKSDLNAVRVELPAETDALDRYTVAARELNGWLASDALRQDTARAFYVLEQEFAVEGVTHTRRGFLARVRVEPLGAGNVFAHEQTLSGPKADRLKLYHATGFNVSPVFGLYPDPDNEVAQKLSRAVANAPPLVAVDHLGVVNRLWLVTDQAVTSAVTGLMGPRAIYIADGAPPLRDRAQVLRGSRPRGRRPPGALLSHAPGRHRRPGAAHPADAPRRRRAAGARRGPTVRKTVADVRAGRALR